ncbi:15546_t:CDS:2, partial [Cetraspora pellucida]
GKVECIELWDIDLADLHSVKRFADKFAYEVGELHYLWNHAGVFDFAFEKTKDNFEQQFQVNHLSHLLLTTLLIPTMKKSATPESPCKINFTGSDSMKLGLVDTNMGNVYPFLEPLKHLFMSTFGLPPDTGAKYILYPVLKANIDDGGKYFDQYKLVELTGQAADEELATKFSEKCDELLKNFDASLLD